MIRFPVRAVAATVVVTTIVVMLLLAACSGSDTGGDGNTSIEGLPPEFQRMAEVWELMNREHIDADRLSDQPGTVFTYSLDYLAGTVDTPLAIVVVDFEPGGRVLCMMTDRETSEVQIGLPVEMSFRKLRVVNGIHNYYWKAVPRRRAA